MSNINFHGFIAAVAFNKETTTIEVMVNTQHGTKVLRHKVGSRFGATREQSKALWMELQAAHMDQDHVHFVQREGAKGWPTYFDSILVEQEVVDGNEFAAELA